MRLRSIRARRLLVQLLATLIVATGIPWTEIHAHEHDAAAVFDDGLPAHVALHHNGPAQGGEEHFHENGLFGYCPGASASETDVLAHGAAYGEFPDPSILHLRSHFSPPLRPPARP